MITCSRANCQQVRESNDSDGEPMEQDGGSAHKDLVSPAAAAMTSSGLGMKRTASDGSTEPKRQRAQTQVADPTWALEKQHADAVINFLIR